MKTKITLLAASLVMLTALSFRQISIQNTGEPWTSKQLIEPSELAKVVSSTTTQKTLIFSIGPGGGIPGSIEIGPTQLQENLDKLKSALGNLDKNTPMVIYCGCCPFDDCPNIRPAFKLLNEMNFTNHKLLNLSHNLKTDWIDKGFPVNQ